MLQRERRVPSVRWDSLFLKKFQLLPCGVWLLRLGSIKKFDVAKLLVGDAHNANLAKLGQDGFHALAMYLGVFHTSAMAYVDGELEHGEAILNETLSELGVLLDVLLCLCW